MTLALKPLEARDPDEAHRAATQLELFFDLVSVIAIAAVTATLHHAISEAHGLDMLPGFIFMFVAIWWAWMNFTWFASAFDNGDALYRVLVFVIMAGALTFAAGVSHIAETLDFAYGIAGWVIMRLGMIALWLRAAQSNEAFRTTALRYAAGIAIAQVLWVLLYLARPSSELLFYVFGIAIFIVEFAVPVYAESARQTPWHRHHIIERYGLLNIIVLGEVLLSISFMLGKLYEGHFDMALVVAAISGLVLVFALWWLYFLEEEHLGTSAFWRALLWGYGHIFIFASGALLGAGLGAYMDVLTDHSKVTAGVAAAYVNAAVVIYLFTLWLIRDRFADRGWRCHVLLAGAVLFVLLAFAGPPPWVSALAAIGVLIARVPVRE